MKLLPFAVMVLGIGLTAQAQGPATAPSDIPIARIDSDFDLVGKATAIVGERERDPIATITSDMKIAADLLGRFNTSKPVQPQQESIIGSLTALIEMLEKQQRTAKGGTSPNPTNPLPDSAVVGGKLTYGSMRDPGASTRLWGQLPPKQREQILQSQNEGFPSGYEAILSSYYRRLAQESVTEPAAVPPQQAP